VNAIKYENDSLTFRYEWNFGDGSSKGIGPRVVHCYPGPGTYNISLDVIDLITKEVVYNEASFTEEILDEEQAYISGPDEGIAGQRLMFNADSTNLPGWNIARYYWNFDDENVAIGKEVANSYIRPGTYNIQLIVTAEPDQEGVIRETCVCKNIVVKRQP
jgi:PKD repeat protein